MIPTVGRIVHYCLTAEDAEQINRRRQDAQSNMYEHQVNKKGVMVHVGNMAQLGQVLPMIVVRINGPGDYINGQVFLDGNDLFWARSASQGTGPGTWRWPPREKLTSPPEKE